MVFQNYALYPRMKVFDNMADGLKIRRVPKDEIRHRVDKAAAILELTQERLGTTSECVTHDQVEAMTPGHRLIVLNQEQGEELGADTLLHGYFGENRTDMTLRLDGIRAFNSGEVLPVRVAADRIHLFAPDTEKRL